MPIDRPFNARLSPYFAHASDPTRPARRPAAGWALKALTAAACMGAWTAMAAPTQPPAKSASAELTKPAAPLRSALDAPLFYELLLGEIELRSGNLGQAFQPILDAARRTHDERLYLRAVEIAVRAQAGEQALSAAKAWRTALPQSRTACEYVAQILLALNRPNETVEPLRAAINLTPASIRSGAVASVPRFMARIPDHKQAAQLIDEITSPSRADPGTAATAWVASGRGWLAAGDADRALDAARKAIAADPADDGASLLLTDLVGRADGAEALLKTRLAAKPKNAALRLAYARRLIEAQRLADSATELEQVTQLAPDYEAGWLTLGAVQLDLHQPRQAETALKQYVALRDARRAKAAQAAAAASAAPAASAASDTAEDHAGQVLAAMTAAGHEQDNQAYLLLSQAAQQDGKLDAALSWLDRIPAQDGGLPIQFRRAFILQKLGRIDEARDLIHKAPASTPQEARSKVLAESTLLRDAQHWRQAYAVLEEGNKAFPNDADLLYEQGMLAEKLKRYDDMERLLRKVIALQPDSPNAYNALGFSLADHNQRLPEARKLVVKALDLSPGDPFITDSLGWVEFRLGHLDEALRLLREAYKSRQDPEIAAHIGEVLWQQGKQDEARSIWREGHTKDANNETLNETLQRLKVSL